MDIKRQHRLYQWKDGKKLELGEKSLVMGILNVTPDSFSDGGKWNSDTLAVSHTTDMIKEGAAIIDVGAESTRPGSTALTAEEETKRLMAFLPDVLKLSLVPVSIDSYHYETMEKALSAGVKADNIILDPGIGFSKTGEQNMEILSRLDELTTAYPCPWLLGVSRKRFIGTILGTDASERDEGTAAVNLWGAEKGCTIFRVHDVKTTARELKVWDALRLWH